MSEQPPVAQPEAQSASADDIATQAGQTASESAPDSMDVAGQGDRPSDADIILQQNQIREEQEQRMPYLGEVEPLSALEAEYAGGSEVFRTKIQGLARSYSSFRRSRGDGNCFFRAFLFAYLENILQRQDYAERARVVQRIQEARQKLLDSGYQELVFEDAQDFLLTQLNNINAGPEGMTAEVLLINMRDDMVSNMIVSFLRLATSAEIGSRAEFFAPFILGMTADELSVEAFRQRCVEPMGEESDHVHIVALSDMLQVPISVLYLDRSMDTVGADLSAVNRHDFVPEALAEAAKGGSPEAVAQATPRVHLLYRPGHYDIMYPHGTAAPAAQQPQVRGGPAASGATGGGSGLDDVAVSRSLAATLDAIRDGSVTAGGGVSQGFA
mmetsp:Transcript_17237/g.51603  ORF Transcript_17237/g.51603 Transcript_17237/m.51603 type:complete len:384 (-) Transcript_17237:269-1420(-)|eukprot:CAMPEP_0206134866 /NCGR_PEP_ID=MMETSP1473-20131121/273_1 /ASSEMBLY_ACC=CAM_ASM_001109 /TAXON_ID=1461547 /ORGANISM="Stichococcus sp, Strain RCC1054" /LENGTH=383 /DNA_ID=CAMNT_0053526497 /DNA_START=125 /DNA_END=1276 /DNA_ORIENTATION=-